LRITEVLALRAWALQSLAGSPSEAPQCSSTSWRHFLRGERCALPLKACLVASERYGLLDQQARTELDGLAAREMQRVLSTRAQLLLIDRLAGAHGWSVVVLKGGVAALSDRDAVDLTDVDVLTPPDQARALAAALDSVGYRDLGPSSPFHLKAMTAEGALPLEIHANVDMAGCEWGESIWSRVVPLARTTCLGRLAVRDSLWHLLVHVGVAHAYRRGAIRDLVLTSRALIECSPAEAAEVTARIAGHPYADALRDLLYMARGLAGMGPLTDRFAHQAAVSHYLLSQDSWLPLGAVLRGDIGRWAVALLAGRPEMRTEWNRVGAITRGVSLSRPIAWVEQRAPRLGRAVRVAARLLRVSIGIAVGLPLAAAAAVVASRATRRTTAPPA
jgi:hypothetical protein